jgi:hypothetical protein
LSTLIVDLMVLCINVARMKCERVFLLYRYHFTQVKA